MDNLTSWVGPKDIPLRMRPLALQIGPYWDVLRTLGRFSGTFSGRPRDIILPSEHHKNFISLISICKSYMKNNMSE